MSGFTNAFIFLVTTLCDLYSFILILRIMLLWARADWTNPIMQFIGKLTNGVFIRIKRWVPAIGRIRHGEILYCLFVFVLVELAKFLFVALVRLDFPNPLGLLILILADFIKLGLNVYFYAILAQVILTWFPYSHAEIYNLLSYITAPLMRPLRRIIPPIGGFDISPIPALIGLQFLVLLLAEPLGNYGYALAFG